MSAGAAVGYGFLGLFLGALISTPLVIFAKLEEANSYWLVYPQVFGKILGVPIDKEKMRESKEALSRARALYISSTVPPVVGAITGSVLGATVKPSKSTVQKRRLSTRKRSSIRSRR